MFHAIAFIQQQDVFKRELSLLVRQAQSFDRIGFVIPLHQRLQNLDNIPEFSVQQSSMLVSVSVDEKKQNLVIQGASLDFKTAQTVQVFFGGEKVVSVAITPIAYRPNVVLIIGSPRSGTTAVGRAIGHVLGKKTHGEAHIGELFYKYCEDTVNFFESSRAAKVTGNLINDMSVAQILSAQCQMLRGLHKSIYGDIVIDKTPGIPNIKALKWLMMVYPQAKVIYCSRRGLENISSRLRKFPNVEFEAHCRQWRQAFASWRKAKIDICRSLGRDDWFSDIEQYYMLHNAKAESAKIAKLISLNPTKQDKLSRFLTEKRPQQTSKNSEALDFESIPWNEKQKQIFMTVCSDEMAVQGYSYDGGYFTEAKRETN